jgi:hypothetical protein
MLRRRLPQLFPYFDFDARLAGRDRRNKSRVAIDEG